MWFRICIVLFQNSACGLHSIHPFFKSTPFISAPVCTINISPLPLLCTTANHYSIVSATTGCPAATTNTNDPDDTVMASVFPGDHPMTFVAEAPLTVIAPAGYNNTAIVAFAVATTTGTAAATQCAGAAMLAVSKIVNAGQHTLLLRLCLRLHWWR